MVVAPVVRGLFGLEPERGGASVRFAPQLPADWDRAEVSRFAAADALFDFSLTREDGRLRIRVNRRAAPKEKQPGAASNDRRESAPPPSRLSVAPAFPLDARLRSATVNGRPVRFALTRTGDVQHAEVSVEVSKTAEVVFNYEEGTDVYTAREAPAPGARSRGLRVLRSRAESGALRLLLEGRGARTYSLRLKTPHTPAPGEGYQLAPARPGEYMLSITFPPPADAYLRRELTIPLAAAR
jgi:hypothetical protein